jgi:hypothetical protein
MPGRKADVDAGADKNEFVGVGVGADRKEVAGADVGAGTNAFAGFAVCAGKNGFTGADVVNRFGLLALIAGATSAPEGANLIGFFDASKRPFWTPLLDPRKPGVVDGAFGAKGFDGAASGTGLGFFKNGLVFATSELGPVGAAGLKGFVVGASVVVAPKLLFGCVKPLDGAAGASGMNSEVSSSVSTCVELIISPFLCACCTVIACITAENARSCRFFSTMPCEKVWGLKSAASGKAVFTKPFAVTSRNVGPPLVVLN